MHVLSVLLGLIIAWVILFFIGSKPTVSYYVQAPVVGLPISEIDSAMEAVGLASSDWKGKAAAPSPAPAPVHKPEPSVADMAMMEQVPSPVGQDANLISPAPAPSPVGQDTYATPQPFSPAPAPSPALQ